MTWQTKIVPGFGSENEPILSVLCKRTYVFANGKMALVDANEQIPFHEQDSFYDDNDPKKDAPKHETDLIAYKPLTDVILHASAKAPQGKTAYYLDVGIMVGQSQKLARVFGERHAIITASGLAFSQPEPFDTMRLDYSRAYGGSDLKSAPGTVFTYAKNPIGQGFVIKNDPASLQGLRLPNLEDPFKLLTPANLVLGKYENWMQFPDPVAFGFLPRNAHPRFLFAGMLPKEKSDAENHSKVHTEAKEDVGDSARADSAPQPMMNSEYYNGASAGLRLPYLEGDETIKLRFMDALFPAFEFQMNSEKPTLWLNVGKGQQLLKPILQTVEIFKETNQYTVIWSGSLRYGGIETLKDLPQLDFGVTSQ